MNAPIPPAPDAQEQIVASRILSTVARVVSTELSALTRWLVAGHAAALALLLANISTVAGFIPPSQLRVAILFFLGGLIAHIVQRWAAAIASGSRESEIETGKAIEEVVNPASSAGAVVDLLKRVLARVTHETDRAALPGFRWWLRRQVAKVAEGDLMGSARMQMMLMKVQTVTVLLQLLFALLSIGVVAVSLRAP
jgi:hypothetical protein